MKTEEQAVAAVLNAYRDAVNQGDANAVAALFAADGVLMAQESPSSVGNAAVHAAYTAIFANIALKIDFKIAELNQVAPDWAFVRSTSSGTITIKANGATIPEANQELFLFQKVAGIWHIARYSFSVTSPAQP